MFAYISLTQFLKGLVTCLASEGSPGTGSRVPPASEPIDPFWTFIVFVTGGVAMRDLDMMLLGSFISRRCASF